MDCSICGDAIETTWFGWSDGNNAEPVVEGGRCCNTCDMTVVLPARMEEVGFSKGTAQAIGQQFVADPKLQKERYRFDRNHRLSHPTPTKPQPHTPTQP